MIDVKARLSLSAYNGNLSDDETDHLIRIAQHVPYDVDTDTYRTTPEADDAMASLITAFLPLLHKVARTSQVLSEDDALQTCLEEFLSAVRRYELGSALPFKAGLRTILLRKIGDVGRTSGLIVVKENAAARYRQIMDKHDWDLAAAYADCINYEFTKDTFLAVHRALSVDSLDVNLDGGGQEAFKGTAVRNSREQFLAAPEPNPEDITVQAETIRYLFTLVPDAQETILRLAYGFADLPTEIARVNAGLRADGSPLSDRDVALVLGMRTPTVNRHRNAALTTMRDALAEEDEAA